MASTPFDGPLPGSPYTFDIFNDGQALRTTAPVLPGGPCNYTDQTLPRCGCRRFWSRALQDNAPNLVEVCMCSHHACFHEDVHPAQAQPVAMAGAAGQENQRPRTNREPLSPVQDLPSFHMPASLGSSRDFNFLDFQTSASAPRIEAANPAPAQDARPGQDSPMPDTFTSWGDLPRTQAGYANGLPPFPAQCVMSPQPPSTASSSQARYLRPFAGKGLQTLSGASASRPEERRPERTNEDGGAESMPDRASASRSDVTPRPSQNSSVQGSDGAAYQKLVDRVDSHEQRLDRLETASFSIAGHEDCHDKHEHIDLRVTELESRVEEVERVLNDNGSIASGRRTVRQDGGADDATASVVSVSTNATVLASNRAEVYSQLQALQAQISQLQAAALPSYAKPWELEVVFLPFPLKGIWIEAREFPSQRRSTGSGVDEWTQMPNTLSRATPDPQTPRFQEWAGQGPESNWLLPKAFPAGRAIDQRLKSRGLMRTILVRGADARSVQLAVHNAFGDILRISSNPDIRSGFAPDYPLAEFLGLRQPWVPLRKLHKDSRLRFLTPAEMATPALWDFTFLVSSVVMKATGIQRLYITQPEAYLQDHPLGYHAIESGWTWQKLRELSRIYPDSQSSIGDVPEADAMEECWAWNDRLDEPPGVDTSAVSLRQSHQQRISRRTSTEPSQQFYTGVQSPILSNGHGLSRGQSPLIQRERKGSWPPHIRTGSLPPVAPALLSPAQSRRRVSSHAASAVPYDRRSSPLVARASPRPSPRLGAHGNVAAASVVPMPKRRFTRSPSLVPHNTPRWSRTSMSRSPSLAPGGLYGYHDERDRERRTTPFYYATPHSEAHPEPYGYQRAGSRGPPAVLRTNGYDPDDDEDMNDGDYDDDDGDQGSSTDPYDSEMTDDVHGAGGGAASGHGRSSSRNNRNGSFGFGTDGDEADLDIDVYEDEDEDELDGVDTDNNNDAAAAAATGPWHGFGRQVGSSPSQQSQPLRPEDIPWAGIEDAEDNEEMMSDGENMDPLSGSGTQSQSHSQSQREEIEIHVDDDVAQQQEQQEQQQQQQHRHQQRHHHHHHSHHHQEDVELADGDDDHDDGASNSSQAPSEYSSKPAAWQIIPVAPATTIATATTAATAIATACAGGFSGGITEGASQQQQKQVMVMGTTTTSRGESAVMGFFRIHEDGTAGAAESGEVLLDTQRG